MADIVPFGKYKNQPLAALAQDKGYCEWLAGQSWVAERFPQIHTIIINNFAEPTETPEHNALQLRFLDEAVRLKVSMCWALAARPMYYTFRQGLYRPLLACVTDPIFEERGIDVHWDVTIWYPSRVTRTIAGLYEHRIPEGTYLWTQHEVTLAVECKPSLGDDYPAVLRFLHGLPETLHGLSLAKVVVAEQWSFRGGTVSQVQALFQSSGVLLLDMAGLETLPSIACIEKRDLPAVESYAKGAKISQLEERGMP